MHSESGVFAYDREKGCNRKLKKRDTRGVVLDDTKYHERRVLRQASGISA